MRSSQYSCTGQTTYIRETWVSFQFMSQRTGKVGQTLFKKLSAPETLLKTTLKIDTPGIFVPWHFTIFWKNLQRVGG